MSIRRLSLFVASALTLAATSAIANPAQVNVTWAPIDSLAEVKQNSVNRGQLRPEEWTKALGDYLRDSAAKQLPPGETLDVTINDVKLAGNFEPWRGPNAQDIRIMKDIYPPSMDVHYKLIGANGAVIRETDAKLRDLNYLQHDLTPTDSDPLRYDKRMINDWVRREFRRDNA
jgi:hypothetical protein